MISWPAKLLPIDLYLNQFSRGSNSGRIGSGLLIGLLAFAFLVFFAPTLLNPFARDALQSWLRAETGAEVSVGRVALSWRQITILDLLYHDPRHAIELRVPTLRWQVSGINPFASPTGANFRALLAVRDPSLTWTVGSDQHSPRSNNQQIPPPEAKQPLANWLKAWFLGPAGGLTQYFSNKIQVDVDRGELDFRYLASAPGEKERIQTIRATHLTLRYQPEEASTSLGSIMSTAKLNINGWGLRMQVPLEIYSQLKLHQDQWNGEATRLKVAGLELVGRGISNFATSQHHWTLHANVPDLAQVKVLPSFLPPGIWRGSLSSKLNIVKQAQRQLMISGLLNAQKLVGDVEWSSVDGHAKGLMSGSVYADFFFERSLLLRQANLEFDLSQVDLAITDLLKKPAGVRLTVKTHADRQSRYFRLHDLTVKFANFAAQAKGNVDYTPGSLSQLSLEVPRTSLLGWETYFPFLGGAPISGSLELKGVFEGDWQRLNQASIKLQPFNLSRVRAYINWQNPVQNIQVTGPVSFNSQGELEIAGTKILRANFDGDFDATNLRLRWASAFSKLGAQKLKIKMSMHQDQAVLRIPAAWIETHAGTVRLSGEITELSKFNLLASGQKLNVSQLRSWFPNALPLNWIDQLNLNLQFAGHYLWDQQKWSTPPQLTGTLQASTESLTIPPPAEQTVQSETQTPTKFFPRLIYQSKLNGNWNFAEVRFNDWSAQNLTTQGVWNQQHYKGTITQGSLLGGSLLNSQVEIQTQPLVFKSDLSFERISAADLLSHVVPTPLWRGPTSGKVELLIPWSSTGLKQVSARGDFKTLPSTLAIPFTQQLKMEAQVLNLPQLAGLVPDAGELTGTFGYHDRTLTLQSLQYSAEKQVRWQGKGTIKDDVQLSGQLQLSPPISRKSPLLNWQYSGSLDAPRMSIDARPLASAQQTKANTARDTAHADSASSTHPAPAIPRTTRPIEPAPAQAPPPQSLPTTSETKAAGPDGSQK